METRKSLNVSLVSGQSYDWSCGLAALCFAMRLMSIETTENKLSSILKKNNAEHRDIGYLMSDLGLACQLYGITTKLGIPGYTKSYLGIRGSTNNVKMEIKHKLTTTLDHNIKYRLISLSRYIEYGGEVYCFADEWRPYYKDIQKVIRRGDIVLAEVDCVEYYGIENEYWSHSILIYHTQDGFSTFDPYKEKAKQDYINWKQLISNSKRFDWKTWRGYLLEIYQHETCKKSTYTYK